MFDSPEIREISLLSEEEKQKLINVAIKGLAKSKPKSEDYWSHLSAVMCIGQIQYLDKLKGRISNN